MTKDETLKLALEVAKIRWHGPSSERSYVDKMLIDACEEVLAQPAQQEPVAWRKQLTGAQRNELKQIDDGTWEADRNG